MLDLLLSVFSAQSGLSSLALEKHLQLERVTVGGNNEVPHLMETGVSAITRLAETCTRVYTHRQIFL